MILSCSVSFAQDWNRTLDSLQSCLKTVKDDSSKAGILRNIGVEYSNAGNYQKAIEYALQSKKIFERINSEYGIFYCDMMLGVSYNQMGDYKLSLNYLSNAKRGIDDSWLFDNIAFVWHNLNDIDRALMYWEKSLSLCTDSLYIPRILNSIGSMYELKNKPSVAISYYEKSLKLSEQIKDNNSIALALASLGDVYFSNGETELAFYYEYKSLSLAKYVNNLLSIQQTEKVLSDMYFKIGKYDSAFFRYKNYIAIKDSLVNEDNIRATTQMQQEYKFDKEREISAEKLAKQKQQKSFFIIGLIAVIIFSVFLFRAFKINKKAKIIITEQKRVVEEKKKEMTDNINYAQRIQKAILPSDEYIKNYFPENFIIYKPKDIVSGDFYWAFHDLNGDKYFATADCTGHGVSGAMMSMIGTQLLNEIVIEKNIRRPDLILNALRYEIVKSLNPQGAIEERKDGMDISFCKLIPSRTSMGYKLESACANNSIFIVRQGQVKELKPDRMPVGKYIGDEKLFTLNETDLELGDIIYTITDGFCDQFGGDKGKKLMPKRFKEWIIELSPLEIPQIKFELESRFNQWIGEGEQIDDVTIFSVRI